MSKTVDKEFLEYLFRRKFLFELEIKDIEVPKLEEDCKKCYGLVHNIMRDNLKKRIRDIDLIIIKYTTSSL